MIQGGFKLSEIKTIMNAASIDTESQGRGPDSEALFRQGYNLESILHALESIPNEDQNQS